MGNGASIRVGSAPASPQQQQQQQEQQCIDNDETIVTPFSKEENDEEKCDLDYQKKILQLTRTIEVYILLHEYKHDILHMIT